MTNTIRRAFIGHGEFGTLFTRQAVARGGVDIGFYDILFGPRGVALPARPSRPAIVGYTYCSTSERFDIVRTEPLPSRA